MKITFGMALVTMAVVILLATAPTSSLGQGPRARLLTVFDREGKTVGTIGERGPYEQPAFSPDRTRVAVIKNGDLWVMDVATGASTPITSSKTGEEERTRTP